MSEPSEDAIQAALEARNEYLENNQSLYVCTKVMLRAAYAVDRGEAPRDTLRQNAGVQYGNPLTVGGLIQVYEDWLTSLAFIPPSAESASQSFAEFAIGHNVFGGAPHDGEPG